MGYEIYLDNILLPVTPESISVKAQSKNESFSLASGDDFTFLKGVGLREISFDAMLPNQQYPFASYSNNEYRPAFYFLLQIKNFIQDKKSLRLKIIRRKPNGKFIFDDDIEVVLDSYDINEEAGNGFDVLVSLSFKEYKDMAKEVLEEKKKAVQNVNTRETKTSPTPKTNQSYTVKSGDTLSSIAKHFYGDASKYGLILLANKDKIKSANLIYPKQVLIIPKVKK